ncbi:hypothetical protein [Nocardioides sp. YIM 152588]|uniref:hypothetical protein n=1 Tax=Nocardioides sp. YIM 152588 TaxID=3158259 RepID=UPI0032E46224
MPDHPTTGVPAGVPSGGPTAGSVRDGRPPRTGTRPTVTPALVAAAVLAAYLAFVGARLAVFDGDPSAFVAAGDGVTDPGTAPDGLLVTPGVDGYDGQAYYRLARSPLTEAVSDLGITFRRPAYWQARIGYPATAWVLSGGGRGGAVPVALLAVNLAAVAVIALLAAALARDAGRSPWWGAVPALWPGYLVGVGQDLSEPLAGALLLAALLALRRDRPLPATVLLLLAALTRETTLVVALAVLAVGMTRAVGEAAGGAERLRARIGAAPAWWVGAVPLAGYAAWRTWVRARWADQLPDPPADNNLGPPLRALAHYLGRAAGDLAGGGTGEVGNLVLLVPTLVVVALLAGILVRVDGPAYERLALAGYLALLLCLPVWDRGQAYLRWGCEPVLLGWLLLVARRVPPGGPSGPARPAAAIAALTVALWLVAATQSVGYPRPGEGWWSWS